MAVAALKKEIIDKQQDNGALGAVNTATTAQIRVATQADSLYYYCGGTATRKFS